MNAVTDEQIESREREWREQRAKQDRKEEEARKYKENFCKRFGLKYEERALIRPRAEKKCRAIIEYLELAPTDEDLTKGKIFTTNREEFIIFSGYVSTKQGGLIACVEIIHRDDHHECYGGRTSGESSYFRDWIWHKVYEHHKTAEDIAREEDCKRRNEEHVARRAEWQKKNSELRIAESIELQAQVKHSAVPDPLVDELVSLAVKETDVQRESSPDRRPTFAPPIPFSKDLIGALERLKALDPKIEFEPGYGRLWAVWESPKKAHGKCKGFELRVGKAHDSEVITNIRPGYRRQADGEGFRLGWSWWTGPDWSVPSLYLTEWMDEAHIAKQEKTYNARKERFLLDCELRELGILEILKFAGAPEEVMLAGARFAEICCCCGRALTDPTSMALGIGPECIKGAIRLAEFLDGWTKEQTEAYYLAKQDKQTALAMEKYNG